MYSTVPETVRDEDENALMDVRSDGDGSSEEW